MSEEPRIDMSDEALARWFQVSLPETFWRLQRVHILVRVKEAPRPRPAAWLLVPACVAGLCLSVLVFQERRALSSFPPREDWAMLENLNLLANLDTIERLRDAP